jgi:hypothetical protein
MNRINATIRAARGSIASQGVHIAVDFGSFSSGLLIGLRERVEHIGKVWLGTIAILASAALVSGS